MTSQVNHRLQLSGNRMFTEHDHYWMQRAYELAHEACRLNEVPVGAVLVLENQLIGVGHNQPISNEDPTAHAEIVAIRQGAAKLSNYRLLNTTLYVTLEPCMMCAGAMVHARIGKLIYGASDPKAGAIESKIAALDHVFLNHRISYKGGLMQTECGHLLSDFFKDKRK